MRKDGVIYIKINEFMHVCGHGDMGTCTHQVLAATLPLSQPGGQNSSPSSYNKVDYISSSQHEKASLHACTKSYTYLGFNMD